MSGWPLLRSGTLTHSSKSVPDTFRRCSRYYTSPRDSDSRLLLSRAITCDHETLYDVHATKYTDQEHPKLRPNAPGLNSGTIEANLFIRVESRAVAGIRRERQTRPHMGISVERDLTVHSLLLETLICRRDVFRGSGVSGVIDPLLSLAQVIDRDVKASYRRWIRSRMEV